MKKVLEQTASTLATARAAFKHFGRFLADQKPMLARGALATGLVTAAELARPWPLKLIVDSVLRSKGKPPPGPLADLSPEQLIWFSGAALVLIPLTIGFFTMTAQVTLAQVGRKVTTRIRRLVCEHLQLLPLSFHHRAATGDLLVRIFGDVNMVRDIIFAGWISLVQRVLLFGCTLGFLIWIDPMMGLLPLVPLPLLVISMRRSTHKMHLVVRQQRKKEGGAASLANQLLRQIHLIKAYGAEERSARLFTNLARSGEKAGVQATRIAAKAGLQTEVLTGVGLGAVLLVGSHQVLSGNLTVGALLVVLSYTRALYKPLRKVARDGVRLAKAASCAERLIEILDLPPEKKLKGQPAPPFRGTIRFQGVRHRYTEDRMALHGLDFEIPAGTLCVLQGANGSGKSTTLGLLLRLLDPTEGEILVDGTPVGHFALDSYRERFAYVPQNDLLFSGTIRENILFARPDATDSDIEEAAREACVTDFTRSFPEGLDTEIGEDGVRLSGGQRRRISLARAALRHASILLLDEPLEGLDPKARREVARAIRSIARGRTTVVVSHTQVEDLAPDMILELREGRLLEATG